MSASSEEALYFIVGDEYSGDRLDKVLAQLMPSVSRARLQTWIEQGAVTVNGEVTEKIRTKVAAGDEIEVLEQPSPEELAFKPVQMPLDVVYEDDDILVVNKPAGLVVHPAAGHWDDTLLNGLLARNPELKTLPRAGIVHRLDRDTTGLMVVAKTLEAQTDLIRQLQARTVKREYWAKPVLLMSRLCGIRVHRFVSAWDKVQELKKLKPMYGWSILLMFPESVRHHCRFRG